VTPAVRRVAVLFLEGEQGLSERRACGLLTMHRSTARYQGHRHPDGPIRTRLRELAAQKRRYGYRRLHVLLRREGVCINHKCVERIYREEGLSLRRKKRKRACSVARTPAPRPLRPDEVWCLDFVHDQLGYGRRIRTLNVLDVCTREALGMKWTRRFPACASAACWIGSSMSAARRRKRSSWTTGRS
jgi:putative transposase